MIPMIVLWTIVCMHLFPVAHVSAKTAVLLAKVEVSDTPLLRLTANVSPYGPPPQTAMNVEANITSELRQLKINGVFTVRTKEGELTAALFNSTMSLCNFLENPSSNRLLQIIQGEVMHTSNLPNKCPLRAGIYNIRNASFAKARIPGFLPTSHFRVDVNLLAGNPSRVVVETRWYALCVLSTHVELVNAFMKLLAIGSKLELNTNIRSINISYVFRQPAQVIDQSIDFEIEIIRQINDMKLQFAYYGVSRNGSMQNAILKRQVDLCFFLRHPKSDRVVNVVYHYVETHGHTPSRCPMAKGSYYMRNLKPADIPIPAFLPEAQFVLELIYRSEVRSVPLVEFRFHGKLMRFIDNLMPVASKVDVKYHKLTLNMSHSFNEPKSVLNQSLDFHIDILRPIKDVKLLFVLSSASRNGTVQNALIKRQIDLCFFLRNPKSDRLLRTLYDYIRERSHIPDRCPFAPGSYYMRHLRLADIPTPAFLPETDFVLELIYFSEMVIVGSRAEARNNVKYMNITVYFTEPKAYTNQSLNLDINIPRSLKDLKLVMVYYAAAMNGTIQSAVLRRTIDLCFFVRRPTSDRLLKSVYDYIKKRSHLPTGCPIQPADYNMRNLQLADIPIPALIPESEFILELTYLTGLRQEVAAEFRMFGKMLVPVASKVECKINSRTFNVSYKLHQGKSLSNQSLDFDIVVTREIKELKPAGTSFVLQVNNAFLFSEWKQKLLFNYYAVTLNGTVQNAIIKRPIDVCFFFRNPRSDRLVKSIYDYVRERSNIPTRCPIARGSYYMRDIRLADVPVPAFLPEAEFILELVYYSEVRAEKMLEVRVHGKLLIAVGTKIETQGYGKSLNMSCAFRPTSSLANQTFDCDIEVMREIKDLKLVVNYYVVPLKNVLRTLLFTRSLDMCFFVRNPKSDRLVNVVYSYIKARSNLPSRCPVPVGSYYIRDMLLADVQIPAFLPETDFILEEIYRSEVRHEMLLEYRFHGKLLLFYGTHVEFISHVNNIELTHTFHRRESLTDQSLDFTVDITSPVRDMKLQFIYYSVTNNGTVRTVLLKRAVDMCFYMQQPKSDRLVKVVYDYVRARTNLPMRCPIPIGSYYIRNVRPADVPVPAFLPEAEFILELVYRNEVRREKMVDFRFHGKLLIPVGSKVELISNVKSIVVSHDYQRQPLTNQSMNLQINITRPIKDMKVQFSYYTAGEDGTAKNTVVKRMVDLCFYIRHPNSDRVVKLVYDYVQQRSNLPTRCPINVGNYYMRDLRPLDVPLPAFLPEASFILETVYRSEVRRETMVEFRFHGKLLLAVGTKVEFISNVQSIHVSHEFLRHSPTNQTLNLYINLTRPIKNFKVGGAALTPGWIYYMRDMRPSDVPVPSFLPEASFMLETNYRSEVRRETMIEFRFYGKLVRIIDNIFAR
uniref:Uncharacterized protein n=1 Tax=Anopheles dirus TaxID=7168 RepID=A0A182N307_9DIPT